MLILLRRLRPLAPDKLQFKPTWMHVSDAAASPPTSLPHSCALALPLESVVAIHICSYISIVFFSPVSKECG